MFQVHVVGRHIITRANVNNVEISLQRERYWECTVVVINDHMNINSGKV